MGPSTSSTYSMSPTISKEVNFDTAETISSIISIRNMSPTISKEVNFDSAETISSINSMRKQHILCDMKVTVESMSFSLHKLVLASCSEYFHRMFAGSFKESSENEIILNDIKSNSFEKVIEFMYNARVIITNHNVQDLIVTSKFLLIDDLQKECLKFMEETISVENCLEYKRFAHSNNEKNFEKFCFSFVLNNFMKVKDCNDFLLLSFNHILDIVKQKQLNANEENVYASIMLWVKYDINDRIQYLSKLLDYINLQLISFPYFIDNIEKEDIIKSNFTSFLLDAFKMYSIKNYDGQNINSTYYSNRLNYYTKQLILIVSDDLEIECITIGGEVLPVIKKPILYSCYSLFLNDGRIISFEENNNDRFECYMFDGSSKKWEPAADFIFSDDYDDDDDNDKDKVDDNDNDDYDTDQSDDNYYDYDDDNDNDDDFVHRIGFKQLDNQVYLMCKLYTRQNCFFSFIMSYTGVFASYHIRENKWIKLNKIDIEYFEFESNGLVILDKTIFYVSNLGVLQYNSNDNTWLLLSKPNNDLGFNFATCSLNGFLYVMGGSKKEDELTTELSSAHKFNPITNSWTTIADMNVSRTSAGAVAVNGLIYMIGGENCNSYETYVPECDNWTLSANILKPTDGCKRSWTDAFVLHPEANINPENVTDYYSIE